MNCEAELNLNIMDRPWFEDGPISYNMTDLRQFGLGFLVYDTLDTMITGGNAYDDNLRKG